MSAPPPRLGKYAPGVKAGGKPKPGKPAPKPPVKPASGRKGRFV